MEKEKKELINKILIPLLAFVVVILVVFLMDNYVFLNDKANLTGSSFCPEGFVESDLVYGCVKVTSLENKDNEESKHNFISEEPSVGLSYFNNFADLTYMEWNNSSFTGNYTVYVSRGSCFILNITNTHFVYRCEE